MSVISEHFPGSRGWEAHSINTDSSCHLGVERGHWQPRRLQRVEPSSRGSTVACEATTLRKPQQKRGFTSEVLQGLHINLAGKREPRRGGGCFLRKSEEESEAVSSETWARDLLAPAVKVGFLYYHCHILTSLFDEYQLAWCLAHSWHVINGTLSCWAKVYQYVVHLNSDK